ncbi:MAG TPA: DUF805 domain-containing protein [Rhodocyclaceae bacterium]|nr:DUF805 domain-containing protein [Rhodocyclaceae bacterium]
MTSSTEMNPFVPPQAALVDARTEADTEFKLNLFSPSGRIGRIRYLGYSFGLSILIMAVAGILSAVISPMLVFLGWIVMIYVQVMLAIKRSHDFNVTGWISPLAFVPLVGLVFLFVPGTDGPNRFGNKTAPNGSAGIIAILALVGVMVIGILAAIAIPAYQQKAKAAQMGVAPAVRQ